MRKRPHLNFMGEKVFVVCIYTAARLLGIWGEIYEIGGNFMNESNSGDANWSPAGHNFNLKNAAPFLFAWLKTRNKMGRSVLFFGKRESYKSLRNAHAIRKQFISD